MTVRLESKVPGHEGHCVPVWVNRNQLLNRLDGGITGFFRLVGKLGFRTGPEFHGIVRGRVVQPASQSGKGEQT